MVSLPIPYAVGLPYGKITLDETRTYATLLEELGVKNLIRPPASSPAVAQALAHLDPDVVRVAVHRAPGWLPMSGQVEAAQSHLSHQGVGAGDLFLFYGWFRERTQVNDGLRYRRASDEIHALWGYLEVGHVWNVTETPEPPAWAAGHPHFAYRDTKPFNHGNNTVYVATENLSFDPRLPGGGTLGPYRPQLRLTQHGRTRSHWDLPVCFDPSRGCQMSYNPAKNFTPSEDGRRTMLSSNPIGQEFVVPQATDEIRDWIAEIFELVES
jgi:hypothetical protein